MQQILQCNSNIEIQKLNIDPEYYGSTSATSISTILYPSRMNNKLVLLLLIALMAVFLPLTSNAQLPVLGTAENFVLFTSAGALGNTGVSTLTGDIGTNVGAITGFGEPTVVNGSIEQANSVTAQCSTDVQAAYNEIFSRTPTETGHAPAYGGGETLTPGVYFQGGAGSIGGILNLDAEGDANAIFIFQFGGAFTTGASATVNLLNRASACNIFWIAEGAIAMAALTDIKGTLIASNGAISMGAGGILDGRMLSTVGEATVYEVVASVPDCAALPISLLSFTGHCDKQNNVLRWSTATEINNDYFTVERSPNGDDWSVAGMISGAGNSSTLIHYTLTDKAQTDETTYYRLKQTDFSGSYHYESVIGISKCDRNGADQLTIFPNPSKGKFELRFNGNPDEIKSINVYNSIGQSIYSSDFYESGFDISNQVPGLYFIHVQHNEELISMKFLLSN